MISLPLPLKNFWNTGANLQTISPEIPTTMSAIEQEKFAISIKEMQTLSCALLVYARHLEKRELTDKAAIARSLEERIFHYLQHIR